MGDGRWTMGDGAVGMRDGTVDSQIRAWKSRYGGAPADTTGLEVLHRAREVAFNGHACREERARGRYGSEISTRWCIWIRRRGLAC